MSVNASVRIVLGWAIDCEVFSKSTPRFSSKTGRKIADLTTFSYRILKIHGNVVSLKILNEEAYNEGDIGAMYSSEEWEDDYFNDETDDEIGKITGACYGQVIARIEDEPSRSTIKGCNRVYPVTYEVSAKLKIFQARYNLPEPTLFTRLSFG